MSQPQESEPYSGALTGALGHITINLEAIARNWQSLARLVAPADCAAVVKANAYGLGATRVVPALQRAGCTTFFVATLGEAHQIRSLIGSGRIFVLDGVLPEFASGFADDSIIPVLSTPEEIVLWRKEAKSRGKVLPAALHIDSGLNRLGLSVNDVTDLAATEGAFDGLEIVLTLSHLASADTPDAPENDAQRMAFETLSAKIPAKQKSLAASDGLMLGQAYHFDLVRPGYALYGGQAFQGGPTPVEPVVRVTAKLLQVRTLKAGDFVGYSATFRAANPMTIAIVSAGYADGVARAASAGTGDVGGVVAIAGKSAPIVGRVSMDLIAVDVSHIPAQDLKRGSDVELIGPNVPLDHVGQHAKTIGYEVLTRLSPRFARTYLEEALS